MTIDHGYVEKMSLGIISRRRYLVRHGTNGGTEMTIIAVICLALLTGVAATEVVTV
jgi:hypothetical protein